MKEPSKCQSQSVQTVLTTLEMNGSRLSCGEPGIYDDDYEVEDIMCDQNIISKDIVSLRDESTIILSAKRLRIVIALLGRTLMPAVLKIYYVYMRNQQYLIENFKHYLFSSAVALVANSISSSLASVQKRIIPLRAIGPSDLTQGPSDFTHDQITESLELEKSVECQVLTNPAEISTDVIFIHGLHGGLYKTWKQGRWRHDGHKLNQQYPVKSGENGFHVPPRTGNYLKRTLSGIYGGKSAKSRRKNEAQLCATREEGDWEVVEEIDYDEESDSYSQCWPQDWLPKDCPGVRVIALNYTTDLLWAPFWKKPRKRTGMVERSDEMIQELINIGVGKKPITWVGHSKGGLYIKQILLNALELHKDNKAIYDILLQTKGIIFYSVPHRGSFMADVNLPLLRQSIELLEIQRNCTFVLDQHRRFLAMCESKTLDADIFSFIETSFTLMSILYLKIVAYESADPGIGIKCDVPLDHREICKPAGRDCFLYTELLRIIRNYLDTQY